MQYILHDIRYDTYYTSGTQKNTDGTIGPRWTDDRYEAKRFNSKSEAIIVMRRLKSLKNQNNNSVIYELY